MTSNVTNSLSRVKELDGVVSSDVVSSDVVRLDKNAWDVSGVAAFTSASDGRVSDFADKGNAKDSVVINPKANIIFFETKFLEMMIINPP